MANTAIDGDIKKNITKRRKAISKKMPRYYMCMIEREFPKKYTKNQIWDFKNGKTFNLNILEDLEKIFNN